MDMIFPKAGVMEWTRSPCRNRLIRMKHIGKRLEKSTADIRRILLVDANGSLVTYYQYDVNRRSNVDYLRECFETRKPLKRLWH